MPLTWEDPSKQLGGVAELARGHPVLSRASGSWRASKPCGFDSRRPLSYTSIGVSVQVSC